MNITELKELAEKATPGPWKAISRGAYWDEEEGDVDAVSGPEIIGAEFVEPLSNQQTTRGHCWYRDAAYIAAANPAEILEMIAKLEDAQGEIRALRATEAGLRDRLAAVEADRAQRVPDGKVLVDRGALNLVINALRRDAEQGRSVRGEMADALLASTPAQPAQQEPGGWHPIGTAPKDGSTVLVWLQGPDLPGCAYYANGSWRCPSSGGWVGVVHHWRPLLRSPSHGIRE